MSVVEAGKSVATDSIGYAYDCYAVHTTSLTYAGTIATSTFTPKLYPIESKTSCTVATNKSFWTNTTIFNSNQKGSQWSRNDEKLLLASSQMLWELEQRKADIPEIREVNKIILIQHLADAKPTGVIDSKTCESIETIFVKYGISNFDGTIDLASFQALVINGTAKADWLKILDKHLDMFSVADFVDGVIAYTFINSSLLMHGAGNIAEDINGGTGSGFEAPKITVNKYYCFRNIVACKCGSSRSKLLFY